jgi:hypothetical protein
MTIQEINEPTKLTALSNSSVLALQRNLKRLGYYSGHLDGISGEKTQGAWRQWKADNWLTQPEVIGPASAEQLLAQGSDVVPSVRETSKSALKKAVVEVAKSFGLDLPEQHAYILATIDHETNGTFEPVREAYWLSESWRANNLRYYPYYGRGYVQLTWKANYETYAEILDEPLVDNPDLALDPGIALFVLVHGMKHGKFTGYKLKDYVNSRQKDYVGARYVVNGQDKALRIADLARQYQ